MGLRVLDRAARPFEPRALAGERSAVGGTAGVLRVRQALSILQTGCKLRNLRDALQSSR